MLCFLGMDLFIEYVCNINCGCVYVMLTGPVCLHIIFVRSLISNTTISQWIVEQGTGCKNCGFLNDVRWNVPIFIYLFMIESYTTHEKERQCGDTKLPLKIPNTNIRKSASAYTLDKMRNVVLFKQMGTEVWIVSKQQKGLFTQKR